MPRKRNLNVASEISQNKIIIIFFSKISKKSEESKNILKLTNNCQSRMVFSAWPFLKNENEIKLLWLDGGGTSLSAIYLHLKEAEVEGRIDPRKAV